MKHYELYEMLYFLDFSGEDGAVEQAENEYMTLMDRETVAENEPLERSPDLEQLVEAP